MHAGLLCIAALSLPHTAIHLPAQLLNKACQQNPVQPCPSLLLQLQDPQTAQRVRAIYKPRAYGDAGGWHRTPMEWVAYRLNVLLGLDYVPPVAYRQAAGG